MFSIKSVKELKSRIIITDPDNNIESTWLNGHPSLGKPDQVVWEYESVMDEFKEKLIKKIFL
jgi:hypothetical protein